MGIDYSGSMIVGRHGSNFDIPEEIEDIYDWLEENKLEQLCDHYDAGFSDSYFGFLVRDIEVSKINEDWIKMINDLADEFHKLTGLEAMLIGSQNIY